MSRGPGAQKEDPVQVADKPGNGEHSGTGARLINQWVDLKQYLLNGQEYLEMIAAVTLTPNVSYHRIDDSKRKEQSYEHKTYVGVVGLLAVTLMGVIGVSTAEPTNPEAKQNLPKPDGEPAAG